MCKSVSVDHYLKTICQLQREKGTVRNIDIATAMGHSKPSVTRAVSLLEELGYVTVSEHVIRLTEAGEREAGALLDKYDTIRGFLVSAGVSAPAASHDACELEHGLSDETYQRIKAGRLGEQR